MLNIEHVAGADRDYPELNISPLLTRGLLHVMPSPQMLTRGPSREARRRRMHKPDRKEGRHA
jgi:hypothetical protein